MPRAEDVNGRVDRFQTQASGEALETPFGETLVLEAEQPDPATLEAPPASWADSPFISEYFADEAGYEADGADPRAAEVVELLAELHNAEFDELLFEVVQDAASAYAEQFQFEDATAAQGPAAERFLREYLAPLQTEAEALVERMAQAAAEQDPAAMTERELEGFFAQFEVVDTGLRPVFEDFLGGFGKKVFNVVKKGIKLAGRFMPIAVILRKLASLPFVSALINRVLPFARGKIPAELRPAASLLAKRLLGKQQEQYEEDGLGSASQPAAPPIRQIQEEFDIGVATLLLARDELDSEVALVGMATEAERTDGDPLGELHLARERFIAEVGALGEGQDATEATQHFIPAILPVLRLGLKLARPTVIGFLSRHVSRMIQPYVGAKSKPLARAIVEAGLGMLGETTEETETHVAGAALAGTVEDTVRQVTELNESILDNETLLEAAVAEAFDAAAAANFPPQLIRPELREAELNGTWVLLPTTGRPFYKGFTHVASTRITPQVARAIRTFGGTTLDAVLRDRYGITGPVDARVRIYQAIPGTWLARVASGEREVPSQDALLPLTTEAAGLLLREPGLGRDVGEEFLAGPDTIADGQRFYHLEIPGAQAAGRVAGRHGRRLRLSTHLSIRVATRQDEVRVHWYLSEADAQALATRLGQGPGGGRQLTRLLLRRANAVLKAALTGRAPGRVRLVHEAVPEDHLTGAAVLRRPETLRWLAGWLPAALHSAVTDRFAQRYGRQFTDALANSAPGVTVMVTFKHPRGLHQLGQALRGQPVPSAQARMPTTPPESRVEIFPGHRR